MSSDYDTQALVDRVTLKAFTSSSSSLSPQQIIDLLNDSLRSYLVPLASTLREEWWVGKSDIVLTSDADGQVTVPDSVASTLRTVAWDNAGILTPLSRIEPESSFQYLSMGGSLPIGFELRGYTLTLMPPVPSIALHLTAMLRPPQMVLTEEAGEVESATGSGSVSATLVEVPLDWQGETPDIVDVVSSESPFSVLQEGVAVSGIAGSVVSLTGVNATANAALLAAEAWLSDPGTAPFANIPIELYPLLELDVISTLYQGLGDKRLKGILDRKKELEALAKRTMGPRTTGNSRPIVNMNAPGMRAGWRRW